MNRIYKTVWNRLRRAYVVVSEKKETSWKKKSIVMATVAATITLASNVGAETINTDTTIDGNSNYDTLSITGTTGEYYMPGRIDFGICSERGFTTCNDIVKPEEEFWKRYPNGLDGINAATLTIAESGHLVAETLNLSSANVVYKVRFGYTQEGGGGGDNDQPTYTPFHGTADVVGKKYSVLLVDGGYLNTKTLNFESSENKLIQNSGTSEIERYSGGGLIDLNGGTMTIGTLSSGAIVDSTGGAINAKDVNLTSKTFSASNTTLSTALGEIVDFRQNITKTDALNLSGSDSKVSFIAFQPLA